MTMMYWSKLSTSPGRKTRSFSLCQGSVLLCELIGRMVIKKKHGILF